MWRSDRFDRRVVREHSWYSTAMGPGSNPSLIIAFSPLPCNDDWIYSADCPVGGPVTLGILWRWQSTLGSHGGGSS